MELDRKVAAKRVVEALGGLTATAKFFEIKPPSVSGWLKAGLPSARMRHIKDVRPDLLAEQLPPK